MNKKLVQECVKLSLREAFKGMRAGDGGPFGAVIVRKGKVISVGPGKKNSAGKVIPMDVKKGQVVLFSKYAPHEIKIGDKEYLVLKEEDILCIIE